MIKVTRLNGSELWINAELIEFVEARPDTHISLTSTHQLVVKETPAQVVESVIEYRRQIHARRPRIVEGEME